MTAQPIAAVVLAAGTSSRLGQPKQLLSVGQIPLLQTTLRMVGEARLTPQILVLGVKADNILERIETHGYQVVINDQFATGQASSLRAGLAAVPDHCAGAVLFLGDQPLVPGWLVQQLVEAFEPTQHVAVRPRYTDGPGNPVLLSRELFPELKQISGDVGAREVLRKYSDRVALVDVPQRAAPQDVDTFEDFAAFLSEWSASGAPDVPRFCQRCGHTMSMREIQGRLRPVCPSCNFTLYTDPKVGAVVALWIDGKLLFQQRAISPGLGRWTFPGGFVDRGERVETAVCRELLEETGIVVAEDELQLVGVYSEPGETVILIAYQAEVNGQVPQITDDESLALATFDPTDLPPLAFPRTSKVLHDALTLKRI